MNTSVVLLIVAGVASQGGLSPQAKQAKIRALEAEIAKTESRLATLKRQLAGLKPPQARPMARDRQLLLLAKLTVGERGELPLGGIPCAVRVAQIIDDKAMVIRFGRADLPDCIARHPTKGLAEGRLIDLDGFWKVTGTQKHGTQTLYVLEQD